MRYPLGPSLSLGLFFALAIFAVWPLPLQLRTALPTGDSPVATVPMLNAWTIWWNTESVSRGREGYWDAPIFHPTAGAFGFSEPQPLTTILWPIYRISDSLPATYNSYVLLTLTLNGLFGYLLLRSARTSQLGACLGGAAVLLHPLAIQNLEAIQLTVLWPSLWFLSSILRFDQMPSRKQGIVAGIAVAAMAATCLHHTLFLLLTVGIILVPVLCLRARQQALAPLSSGTVAALITSAALALPLIMPMHRIHSENSLERTPKAVRSLSAQLDDWGTAPQTAAISVGDPSQVEFPLMPGVLRCCLAVALLPYALVRTRGCTLLLTLLAALSFLFSFGPNLEVAGFVPWRLIAHWVPGFSGIRSPYRFAYLVQLSVILLSIIGVEAASAAVRSALWHRQRLHSQKRRWKACFQLVSGSLLVLIAFEIPPPRTHLFHPPLQSRQEAFVQSILESTSPEDAILCLPVAASLSEQDLQQSAIWMLYATQHKRPILNGYSGFIPPTWQQLRGQLAARPLDEELLSTIRRAGAAYLLLRKDLVRSTDVEFASEKLDKLYEDDRYLLLRMKG